MAGLRPQHLIIRLGAMTVGHSDVAELADHLGLTVSGCLAIPAGPTPRRAPGSSVIGSSVVRSSAVPLHRGKGDEDEMLRATASRSVLRPLVPGCSARCTKSGCVKHSAYPTRHWHGGAERCPLATSPSWSVQRSGRRCGRNLADPWHQRRSCCGPRLPVGTETVGVFTPRRRDRRARWHASDRNVMFASGDLSGREIPHATLHQVPTRATGSTTTTSTKCLTAWPRSEPELPTGTRPMDAAIGHPGTPRTRNAIGSAMPLMTIRPASAEDTEAIAAYHHRCWESAFASLWSPASSPGWDARGKIGPMASWLAPESGFVTNGGGLVGYFRSVIRHVGP